MLKRVFEMIDGESFVYRGYLYRATKEFRDATSQRYCEKLAFEMDGEWHTCKGGDGEWFNWYCSAKTAVLTVASRWIVLWQQRAACDKHWTTCAIWYDNAEAARKHRDSLLPGPDGSFGPIQYQLITLASEVACHVQ